MFREAITTLFSRSAELLETHCRTNVVLISVDSNDKVHNLDIYFTSCGTFTVECKALLVLADSEVTAEHMSYVEHYLPFRL